MHIAPDFLLVGLLSPKTFTLRNMPPTLSFCAEPKGEVAESIIRKLTLSLLERGTFTQGKGFPSLFENVDSATSGKPCVQNDMRVK